MCQFEEKMKSRCGKSLNLKTKAMIKQYKYNWKTAKKKKSTLSVIETPVSEKFSSCNLIL